MDIITADFETFYCREYSLSKLTTEEYIRDKRFQVIGVSVKVNEEPPEWFSGTARETIEWLHEFDWKNSALIAHNAMFDAAILSWRCGVKPARLIDTLSMSRAMFGVDAGHSLKALAERLHLPSKGDEVTRAIGKRRLDFTPRELADYGDYCKLDVHLTYEAFRRMMERGFPVQELKLIDATLRMFTDPVLELDRPLLEGHLIATQRHKQKLLDDAGVTDKKDLMSNNKFADMLQELGVSPPMKISPTTGKETFAFAKTDEEFRGLEDHEDPHVQALVSARLGNKSTLEETRTQRFIDMAARGKFPVPLYYYGAHTGRWCLTGDHEVLTREGWVRLDAWSGQPIRQWDAETKKVSWAEKPRVNSFWSEDPVVLFSGKYHKAVYTAEHRMPFLKRHTHEGVRDITAGRFTALKKAQLFVSGYAEDVPGIGGNPEQLRLIVAMHADGYNVQDAKNNMVRFRFKKHRKIRRLKDLLAANSVPFHERAYPSDQGATTIYVRGEDAPDWLRSAKTLPKWFYELGACHARVVLEELVHWDGYRSGPNSFAWAGTDEAAATIYATLGHLAGYRVLTTKLDRRDQGWSVAYKLQFAPRQTITERGENASWQPFSGTVYCPEVPTGYFLCRRDRTIFLTGNSGRDKVNLQNLPSRGPNAKKIKKGIVAPEGHTLIDCDSAQIEARVLAWLAGQEDLVQAFRDKEDVYKIMASNIYGTPIDEVDKGQRQVGKTVILGAGYGVGHVKLQAFLKMQAGVDVPLDEAKRIIDIYRHTNDKISGLWRQAQSMLKGLLHGDKYPVGRPGVVDVVPDEYGIRLPSGLFIRYPGLYAEEGEKGLEMFYKTRKGPSRIYGGKCLAGDTEVLTDSGWVQLRDVTRAHRVWDGSKWVNHGGLIYQGDKATTIVNGVRMTPDHNVLTERGWRCASSSEGLHRAGFWLPDGTEVSGDKWPTLCVDLPLHLRDGSFSGGYRRGKVCPAWWAPVVRLQSWGRHAFARHVTAPRVLGMALNAGPMPAADAPSLAQLRRTRCTGVSRMGSLLRGVLGGHGSDVQTRPDAGSCGQQRGLHPGELSVGVVQDAGEQPPGAAAGGPDQGTRSDGHFAVDPAVSLAPEPVYDILNAGPDARFVVRGSSGPFIVHNCIENVSQALARCIIGEQLLKINKRYRVVLTVHDSIVSCVPEDEVDEAREYIETCMGWTPEWAEGLPVDCESGVGRSYGDCE